MFEELVGKPIYLVKKDNYSRHGLLLEVSDAFIKLEMDDKKTEYISISEIASLKGARI